MIFDCGETLLITLITPVELNGTSYYRVWGVAELAVLGNFTFVKIGGFGNELYISPCEIRFAIPCEHPPQSGGVLICKSDDDDILEILDLHQK